MPGADYLGGYCYLNNAAIAARRADALGLGPVAVLDVDYHHGNGTQDIFLRDPASSTPRSTPIRRPTIRSTGAMPTSAAKAKGPARR